MSQFYDFISCWRVAWSPACLWVPVLYGVLGAVLYYLGSRAEITRPLWSKYPPRFDQFMVCPTCAGFWYGLLLGLAGGWGLGLPFLGLSGRWICTPGIAALWAIWATPVFAATHLYAVDVVARAGGAAPPLGDRDAPVP